LSREERFPKAFKLMRIYAFLWQTFVFVPVRIKGKENIPADGPFLICANHSSFMDIPVTYTVFPRYFIFTGKKEIERWPLFHIFYTSGMNILVDRHNPKGDFKAFKRMMEVIDKGNPLVVFPEGTISKRAPKLTSFKEGAFIIAQKKNVPIVPVTFMNNWKRLERKGFWKGLCGPGFSDVIIHPVINTDMFTKEQVKELKEQVKNTISKPLYQKYRVN